MVTITIVCARCTSTNHVAVRHCGVCGLPLGAVTADAGAVSDALEPYELPEPADQDSMPRVHEFAKRMGYETTLSGHGWRVVVPLRLDRQQAVYVGPAGTDADGRSILSIVSVCGPANDRDCRALLKMNARRVDGHFAIRVLRGEEYFVVMEILPLDSLDSIDPCGIVRRVAELADGLEDRLSRGADIY